MKFNAILRQFEAALKLRYADRLVPSIFQAINALLRCRTEAAGAIKLHCQGGDETSFQPRSCGHRSCSQCQNHETSKWLDRQFAKLLPAEYFMVTFTLPYELRSLAWRNQPVVNCSGNLDSARVWVVYPCIHDLSPVQIFVA
jgi:hypothetical protein